MKKLIILFAVIFFSCNAKKNVDNVIDLSASASSQITNLSEVAEEINYIPLETNDSSIIGRIQELRVTGESYFVSTINVILRFDKSGKFLSKLDKLGRGPEEYDRLYNFDVSQDNKFLAVRSQKSLVLYNINPKGFTFLRRLVYSQMPDAISFTGTNNNLMLMYSNTTGTNPYSKILISISGDTLSKYSNNFRYILKDGWIILNTWENLFYTYNKNLYHKEFQNDTLFQLTDGNLLEPKVIFNSKGKGVTPGVRAEGKYLSDHSLEFMQIQNILESDLYLLFSLSYINNGGLFAINKSTNTKYSISKEGLVDDIAGGIKFKPKFGCNGIFYSWMDAFEIKQNYNKSKASLSSLKEPLKRSLVSDLISNLAEDSNPVIISVKMK